MSLIKKNLNILIMAGGALLVLGLVYMATEKTRISKTVPIQNIPQENGSRFDITLPGSATSGSPFQSVTPAPAPAKTTTGGGKAPAVGGPALGGPKAN